MIRGFDKEGLVGEINIKGPTRRTENMSPEI